MVNVANQKLERPRAVNVADSWKCYMMSDIGSIARSNIQQELKLEIQQLGSEYTRRVNIVTHPHALRLESSRRSPPAVHRA